MNDDETLDALDRRGRQAAAAVREKVAERPVPAFDPDVLRVPVTGPAEPYRPGRRGVLLIAAVVVLVVGVGVALAQTGTDDSGTPPATVPADELRRYVLARPPADMPLSFVWNDRPPAGERFGEVRPDGNVTVYGPSVEDPRLGLVALPRDDEGWGWETDGLEPVDVGGREAWDASEPFGSGALLVDVDGRAVLVHGALEPELAREVAATLELGDDVATIPRDARPAGWRELGVVDRADIRWTAVYQDPSGSGLQPFMVLSVLSGGRLDVTGLLLAGDDARAVEVRGHPGVLVERRGSEPSDRTVTVRWEERPGEVVELVSSSPEVPVDPDEVLALVEELDAVDADEVRGLVTRLRRGVIGATGATVVGEGTFSDGSTWILASGAESIDPWTLSVDGLVDPSTDVWAVGDAVPTTPDGETPATEPGGTRAGGLTLDAQVGRTREDLPVAFGAVTTAAATVEVRTPAGDVLASAEAVTAADGSLAGWVAELPDGVRIDEASGPQIVVVALDASGAELGRLAF